MNKGKFDVRCHSTWLTAKFIISFARVMKKHENKTILSREMYEAVRLACTDPDTRKPFAVFPNKDENTRGKDKKDTSFSISLKSFNEVLKNLGLDKYVDFHGNKGGKYSIGIIDLKSLNIELYGKSEEPMDIVEALADRIRKTSLSKIKASQALPIVEEEESKVEKNEAKKEEQPQDSTALPGVEPAVVRSISKPQPKKKDSLTSTRRSYSAEILREGRYIGILAKYALKEDMKMTLTEIVSILTNNYFLEFTDVFKNSQELKSRICSGKLSTVFNVASDNTIMYKSAGQGIVSFADLEAKYSLINDVQVADLIVYDPHQEWRNSVNTSYIEEFTMRSFTAAPQVCGVRAHWGCTPSALYKAWREFHLPIAGRYHYIGMPAVPLPFIKPEVMPSLEDWAGLVTGKASKELEKMRNTILLYLADLNATA